MAKRKHKLKRKRDDLPEPQEQLSNKRDEAAELIIKQAKLDKVAPANYDIDHNIREIRAILKMNAEILDRCMKFMIANVNNTEKEEKKAAPAKKVAETKKDDGSSSSSSGSSSDSSGSESEDEDKPQGKTVDGTPTEKADEELISEWCASFNRIAYDSVTARAWYDGTQVITHPILTTKEFNTTPLSKLPKGLDGIIVSNNMTGDKLSSFIDFEAFFERALLLHETVLEQFLPKLKEHLMSIQVCLGEIDAWVIQEPQGNITFLEETFGKKMEIPDENVTLGRHRCGCETHDRNERCLRCGKKYCDHSIWDSKRCPNGISRLNRFECSYYQVLKQCNSTGKFETTFNVTNEKEKTKLEKFLEFITID